MKTSRAFFDSTSFVLVCLQTSVRVTDSLIQCRTSVYFLSRVSLRTGLRRRLGRCCVMRRLLHWQRQARRRYCSYSRRGSHRCLGLPLCWCAIPTVLCALFSYLSLLLLFPPSVQKFTNMRVPLSPSKRARRSFSMQLCIPYSLSRLNVTV